MSIHPWITALLLASVASAAAQAPADKTLRGTVTIKTNGQAIAVHGKADTEFLFCIDQERSAPQPVEFTGPARVLYRAVPIIGIPAGVTIQGPESVANTLAVVADNGKAWVFVAKDQKPLLPAGDRTLAGTTIIGASVVRRLDWSTGSGPRRGTDVAGCLQPAG